MGDVLSATNGIWSSEILYGYQWEDCNAEGKECTAILGATNSSYTVRASDAGHTLVAQVTATNGDGSVSASTAKSASVKFEGIEYGMTGSTPVGIVAGPDGNLWSANYGTSKISKVTTSGGTTEYALPSGSDPTGIASGPDGNLWFTDNGTSKVGKITTSGTKTEYTLPSGSEPYAIAAGPDGNLWFTDYGTNQIGKITTSGTKTEYALPSGSHPTGIVAGPDGNLWFTDYGTNEIGKITTSGVITEYALPSGSGPHGIAVGPDGNLWFVDNGTGKIGKISTSGGFIEYTLPSGSEPMDISAGPDGNLWFTDYGTNKVGRVTTSGTIIEYAVPSSSEPYDLMTGPDDDLWVTMFGTSKLGKFVVEPSEQVSGPQPGSTVEYRVPLSGGEGSYLANLTKEATAKWGQKNDLPVEATAIFPPSEPQGWPASDYKSATLLYMDAQARTTNTATPSGAISTVEYNPLNEVTRTLSASDRAIAMKEACESETKCRSAEVAKNLSSEYIFNGEGTQLLETLGPEHEIKLASGVEEETRDHQKNTYDEGGSWKERNLMTKIETWVQNNASEKLTKQESNMTYSNGSQGELGLTLRKPLLVSETVKEKTSTEATTYSPETGSALETATSVSTSAPTYAAQIGSSGSGNGHFSDPAGEAIDASGDLWVTDGVVIVCRSFHGKGRLSRRMDRKGLLGASSWCRAGLP